MTQLKKKGGDRVCRLLLFFFRWVVLSSETDPQTKARSESLSDTSGGASESSYFSSFFFPDSNIHKGLSCLFSFFLFCEARTSSGEAGGGINPLFCWLMLKGSEIHLSQSLPARKANLSFATNSNSHNSASSPLSAPTEGVRQVTAGEQIVWLERAWCFFFRLSFKGWEPRCRISP